MLRFQYRQMAAVWDKEIRVKAYRRSTVRRAQRQHGGCYETL